MNTWERITGFTLWWKQLKETKAEIRKLGRRFDEVERLALRRGEGVAIDSLQMLPLATYTLVELNRTVAFSGIIDVGALGIGDALEITLLSKTKLTDDFKVVQQEKLENKPATPIIAIRELVLPYVKVTVQQTKGQSKMIHFCFDWRT